MHNIRYIPLFLFTIFITKLLVIGVAWADAPIALILASAAAFFEYKTSDKKHQELHDILKKQNEVILAMAKEIDSVKSGVSKVSLAQNLRPQNVARQ